MKKLITFLLLSYVFFISWTSAFALNGWFKIPVLIGLSASFLIVVSLLHQKTISKRVVKSEEVFLFLFIVFLSLNVFISFSTSSINYYAAYIYVFVILYFILKIGFLEYVDTNEILKANSYGILFVCIFIILNFIIEMTANISIQGLIPRLKDPDALYLGLITRSYGFSQEPGNVAQYLNTLGPVAIWNVWQNFRIKSLAKIVITGIVILGWMLLFSAAGLFLILCSFAVVLIIKWSSEISFQVSKYAFVGFLVAMLFLAGGISFLIKNYYLFEYVDPIIRKLTFDPTSGSASKRVVTWIADIQLLDERPLLGHGLGYLSATGRHSSLNWFLFLAVEAGIIVPIMMFLFLFLVFFRMLRSKLNAKYVYMIGLLAGTAHFLLISTFFDSFVWLLIIMYYHHEYYHQKKYRLVWKYI